MTLPRRLLWRDGRLLTPPIDAVETLRAGAPVHLEAGAVLPLPDGLAEIALELPPGQPFALALVHPSHEAMLSYDGETLEFHYEPPGNRVVPSYRASLPGLHALRMFVDVGLIEIYVDGGRACCTKRIDSALPFTAVSLAPGSSTVATTIWSLRPATP